MTDLEDLDGVINGFRIDGENEHDGNLTIVNAAGDINGDGIDDIVIINASEKTYVVFGTDSGFPAEFDLSSLDGSNGFVVVTGSANFLGASANGAGDVNGDGFDDLIIGAFQASPNGESSGSSFIIFGSASPSATIDVDDLDGTTGFRVDGVAIQDNLGKDVSSAGDINGDGFDDILIGAPGVDTNGYNSGAAYVIFGSDEDYPAAIDVDTLDGDIGFRINGALVDSRTGWTVSNAGDINDDGIDDLFIGAPHVGATNGGSYIVFGTDTGVPATLELGTLDGSNGFRITNDVGDEASGMPVSAAGDINGDGIDDIIMGSPGADPHGSNSGSAYVIFGKTTPFAATLNLSTVNGTNGFRIDGSSIGNILGASVSGAGDFNGDGFDDLIVGAKYANPNGHNSGAIYVVFGTNAGFPATLDVSTLNYKNGFKLEGLAPDDQLGYSVSAAGDVNGDGFEDLIVAARGTDQNGSSSGSSYVIFGRASLVTEGTSGVNNITGTEFGDVINALGGADTVNGLAGNDVIDGGDGNDVIDGGAGDDTIQGGIGNDTIQGGEGDNHLAGGAGNDALTSGSGQDTLTGGDGDDTLIAGEGVNTLDGGAGNDTVNYTGAAAGLMIGVSTHAVGGQIFDTLIAVENIVGTNFADFITGSDGNNVLSGNGEQDVISGMGGNDTLSGGDGNDLLDGGLGNDTLNGGVGLDTAIYASAATGVTVNLVTGQATGGYGSDTLISVEHIVGSGFNDVLTGDANANNLSGGGGNNTLVGGDGNDNLASGLGNDTLNGGNGVDTALFTGSSGVTVDLRITTPQAVGGGLGTDTLISIEWLSGSAHNDTLTGNNSNNNLFGNSGNDSLFGLGGNDALNAGSGNDTLNGGAGNDVLSGLGGLDTAVFSGNRSAYTISKIGGLITVSGPDGTDTMTDVEFLAFADTTLSYNPTPNDYNGDGKSDLLWQNIDGQAAIWLLNGINAPISTNLVGVDPGPGWHIVGSADFNNDGKADILWENDHSRAAAWLLNGSTILFADFIGNDPGPGWHIKGTGDFNGDGKVDVLWQNEYGRAAVWLLNGTSLVTSSFVGGDPGASWHIKGSGDFNADGKSDILWQHNDGRVMVWLLDGTNVIGSGEIASPGADWRVAGSGNFNNDGKSDILWQNGEDRAAIWLMDGVNRLDGNAPTVGDSDVGWYVKGTGDFNGDGRTDILRQHVNGHTQILLMNGTTLTSSGYTSTPGATWTIANYGVGSLAQQRSDLNADGRSDILWQNDDGSIMAWLLKGSTIIDDGAIGEYDDPAWQVKTTGDFNADGAWDVLWQHTDGTARITPLSGLYAFDDDEIGNPGADWHIKGSGDFNTDGKSDILWQSDDGDAAVWLMDGLTVLDTSQVGGAPGAGWEVKGSGDFNSDGKSDILWENVDGRAAVWLLDGFDLLDARAVGDAPGAGWHVRGSGDFNGDGNSDILWQNDDGRAAVWLLDGVELIGADVVGDNADVTQQIKGAADYNGDGKSDILWLNDDGQAEIWFMDGLAVADMELVGVAQGSAWSFDWA